MEKTLISGYISLKSILEAKSREVYEVVLDKDRYDKVQASNFHVNEKRQYERRRPRRDVFFFVRVLWIGPLIG